MDKLVEMPEASQGGADDAVLYLRIDGRPTELFEAATYRLDNARNLLDALIGCKTADGGSELSAVVSAATLLLNDASGMLQPLYEKLRELEQLHDGFLPIRLVKPGR